MNLSSMYLATGAATAGGGIGIALVYILIFGGMMYFLAVRPQKKQQKTMNEMSASLEIGDSIVTTGGFYGVVVDIKEDIIIVEFGNNKNCRIPMKKASIQAVEKPDGTTISL